MNVVEIIFILLVFFVLYSFFVYQGLLYILSVLFKNDLKRDDSGIISVTLVISAYNEEKVIRQKILNSIGLNYPQDKLEIIVVSDCSTDKTDQIVMEFKNQGVVLYRSDNRQGKTAGLNTAVERATGEIIVFTDADSMFDKDAILEMSNIYSDSNVGSVTGSTDYISHENCEMVSTSSIYTRLERLTKRLESRIGSCVGADGAIFSVRKSLYLKLNLDDINDLVIPLNVVKQGYRVIYSDKVKCTEEPSTTVGSAYTRQARITNRTLRALFRRLYLINLFKFPLFSFELISHKYIRLSVPFYLIMLLPVNLSIIHQSLIYQLSFLGQLTLYAAALAGYIQNKRGQNNGLLLIVYHFMMIQTAVLKGWIDLVSGVNRVTWNPRS